MTENIYNVQKLTKEFQEANLPIAGVSSTGEIAWSRNLTKAEKTTSQAIIDNHDTSPDDSVILRGEYSKAGIKSEDMIFALWKKVMSSDSTDADAIQSVIDLVNLSVSQ